jgi:hypothetical protein
MHAINSCLIAHLLPLRPARNQGLPAIAEPTKSLRDFGISGEQEKINADAGKDVSETAQPFWKVPGICDGSSCSSVSVAIPKKMQVWEHLKTHLDSTKLGKT